MVMWERFLIKEFLLAILSIKVNCYFEFCSDGARYRIFSEKCPGGVFFKSPMSIRKCQVPKSAMNPREHMESVCGKTTENLGSAVQFVDPGPEDDESSDSCSSDCSDVSEIVISPENTMTEAQLNEYGSSIELDDVTVAPFPEDPRIKNQTLRLFMFMTGNLIDENEGGPIAISPLLNLLNASFSIIKARVDQRFLPEAFFNDIQRAFLFLLRESETTRIKSISRDEERLIKATLDSCKKGNAPIQPIYMNGKVCPTMAKVKAIAKRSAGGTANTTQLYSADEYSFVWGEQDLIEEATWAVMDFVHGYCYGGFAMRVNNHHLYQRAMERLFTKELIYRWKFPQQLKQELYWDNVFSTNVKMAMRNLDAAVQSAYLDSPFVHRLKRPWIKSGEAPNLRPEPEVDAPAPPPPARRRKRQATVPAWCLIQAKDKPTYLDKLKIAC